MITKKTILQTKEKVILQFANGSFFGGFMYTHGRAFSFTVTNDLSKASNFFSKEDAVALIPEIKKLSEKRIYKVKILRYTEEICRSFEEL